jgi:hypothetical protein
MKTTLTILIAALTFVSTAAQAQDFAGGSGTEADPWLITTASQLSNLRNYLGSAHAGKYFRLTADIDLAAFTARTWAVTGWQPVGSGSASFAGHLDGAGHRVTGLWINRITTDYAGLFGALSGSVERLGVVADNTSGGIRGRNYAGLLAGSAAGRISACYVSGAVQGTAFVGALAGRLSADVADCYATGSVTGSLNAGGMAGAIVSGGKLARCYVAVTTGAGSSVGSLVGSGNSNALTQCYYLKTAGAPNGIGGTPDNSAVTARTVGEMKSQAGFVGFDFSAVWTIDEGQTFPYLRGVGNDRPGASTPGGEDPDPNPDPDPDPDEGSPSTDFAGGRGTAANPYLIATPQQLSNLRNYLGETHKNKYFKLSNDLNISTYCTETWGTAGWEPIGTTENYNNTTAFFGHLDGDGHRVNGLWINRGSYNYIGLFGYTGEGSTIDRLGIVMDDGKGGVKGNSQVGGLVGYSSGNITES